MGSAAQTGSYKNKFAVELCERQTQKESRDSSLAWSRRFSLSIEVLHHYQNHHQFRRYSPLNKKQSATPVEGLLVGDMTRYSSVSILMSY